MKNKIVKYFLIGWSLVFLGILFLTIGRIPSISEPSFLPHIFNVIQRSSALFAYLMLAVQIVLGAFIVRFRNKWGDSADKIHKIQGIVIYTLIFSHAFSLILFNIFARNIIDPFYVFVDFCVICPTKPELYISLGRFSFWIITATVLAALLRNHPSWKNNWRYVHLLNYPLFLLVAFHALKMGSDIWGGIFVVPFVIGFIAVVFTILYKIYRFFKDNFRLS